MQCTVVRLIVQEMLCHVRRRQCNADPCHRPIFHEVFSLSIGIVSGEATILCCRGTLLNVWIIEPAIHMTIHGTTGDLDAGTALLQQCRTRFFVPEWYLIAEEYSTS